MTIGEKLRYLRESHDLTQPQVAEKIEVSNGMISLWENDKNEPKATYLSKLADFYECQVDYILNRIEDGEVTYQLDLLQDETQLLIKYRNLVEKNQNMVKGYIDALTDKQKEK